MPFNLDFLSIFRSKKSENSPWWIEIETRQPSYIYYFGPFFERREAAAQKIGFLEDLQAENAQVTRVKIKRTRPSQLTIAKNDV
ncbi:MAG: DUF1816 domain-containing protein [Thainema sp.]